MNRCMNVMSSTLTPKWTCAFLTSKSATRMYSSPSTPSPRPQRHVAGVSSTACTRRHRRDALAFTPSDAHATPTPSPRRRRRGKARQGKGRGPARSGCRRRGRRRPRRTRRRASKSRAGTRRRRAPCRAAGCPSRSSRRRSTSPAARTPVTAGAARARRPARGPGRPSSGSSFVRHRLRAGPARCKSRRLIDTQRYRRRARARTRSGCARGARSRTTPASPFPILFVTARRRVARRSPR
mmetsp:Transcript_15585/g.44357  ORF Transcript_15585/g.44357 Transcript_15585/m.44357 type:complete len:239 (-) Transcript_15585:682-1398(-)